MTIVETSVTEFDLRLLLTPAGPGVAGRHEFYEQIARLDLELTKTIAKLDPSRRPRPSTDAATRPRVLSNQELEKTRDDLVARIGVANDLVALQSTKRAEARALLKRMYEMPAQFPWAQVTTKDLGDPGCRTWASVPRLGPIGMLNNWWRIRMSSGCP
jgi:hypothetical protein